MEICAAPAVIVALNQTSDVGQAATLALHFAGVWAREGKRNHLVIDGLSHVTRRLCEVDLAAREIAAFQHGLTAPGIFHALLDREFPDDGAPP